MQHRYAKLKSTGRIVASLSGGNPDIDDLDVFASGVGWPVDQLEVGYESEEVVSGWWEAQNKADRTYVDKRKSEYPSIPDQLDYIYHNGVEKWKTDMILPVKEKYPKGDS